MPDRQGFTQPLGGKACWSAAMLHCHSSGAPASNMLTCHPAFANEALHAAPIAQLDRPDAQRRRHLRQRTAVGSWLQQDRREPWGRQGPGGPLVSLCLRPTACSSAARGERSWRAMETAGALHQVDAPSSRSRSRSPCPMPSSRSSRTCSIKCPKFSMGISHTSRCTAAPLPSVTVTMPGFVLPAASVKAISLQAQAGGGRQLGPAAAG